MIMKKHLPNLSNMKVLLIVLVSFLIGVTLNAQTWTIYDGSAVPSTTGTPPFSVGDGWTNANIPMTSDGNILTVTAQAGNTSKGTQKSAITAAPVAATWMVRTRTVYSSGTYIRGIDFEFDGSVNRAQLTLMYDATGTYWKFSDASSVSVSSALDFDIQNFHTYRITTSDGTHFKLYIDESATATDLASAKALSSATLSWKFGVTSSTAAQRAGEIDWVAWDNTGAYAPGTTLPSGVIVDGASITTPATPNATAATNLAPTSISANWDAVATATKYYLDVATDDAFTSMLTDYNNKDVSNVTTLQVTGLTANTTYYYRVRANNTAGTSANSNVITAVTTAGGLQPQTITFTLPTGKVFGNAAFDITDITSGGSGNSVVFASSNTAVATVSGNTIAIVGAGTTTITATQDGNGSYEAAAPVSHDLVIGKATATITVNGTKPTYSGTPKSVTTITDPVGKTVNVTYAGSATAPTNAGTYAIVATIDDANYTGTASADLIIGKADLTVTTEPATRMKGLANPAFVLKYTGFVNGETKASLTTEPTATCAATTTSAVGDYPVTVSGGTAANYSFTYVNGTLSVTVNTGTPSLSGIAVNAYPNPVVSGKLQIEVPAFDGKSEVSVISASGVTVMNAKIKSNITELNVSSVAPGVYIVRIETPAGVTIKQVVKP
jgi:hypothetical protein